MVIHSIDCVYLRKFQKALSLVGNITKVRIVASADHVRSPLLWDTVDVAAFSWALQECHTGADFRAERLASHDIEWIDTDIARMAVSYSPKMPRDLGHVPQVGADAELSQTGTVGSLLNIFSSLTATQRRLGKKLAEMQLQKYDSEDQEAKKSLRRERNLNYGISFDALITDSSDVAINLGREKMKMLLIEMTSHHVVIENKDKDTLYMPYPPSVLRTFIQECV
eukprot:GHVO01005299.1.p1 GENE.GHVO01005299.1~~GHVO01005299.1.p1  ORF type:complete len:234 (-),score=40.53 GHVO01005299.1:527-1198(-)